MYASLYTEPYVAKAAELPLVRVALGAEGLGSLHDTKSGGSVAPVNIPHSSTFSPLPFLTSYLEPSLKSATLGEG